MDSAPHETLPVSILFTEDDVAARDILSSMISSKFPGVQLQVADNGAAGLELFRQQTPDIVITDINMPVMNGIRMAAEIRALNPEAIVIVLTAFSDSHYLLEAIELGVSQYVLKPVDYGTFLATIEKSIEVIRLRRRVQELNDSLAARTRELEAANLELAAFNYSVSHDLRTPLAAISGYFQLIQESCADRLGEPCREYLKEIQQITRQMDQLIGTLLKLSQVNHGEVNRQSVDLSRIAAEVTRTLQMTKPDRRVEFRIAQGISAQGDPKLLRLALGNLLGNAWKFTDKQKKPLIEFGAIESAGGPAYFVRDNGAGFDMNLADKLFVAFQRLHGSDDFAGDGIGLATVQRVIQRHGGRTWAEGEVGKGATFYFTLKA